ncbi:DUF1775 domain-containing protein [Devosia sp.]|uniref:YcnI family copper-binding membrane protein n=1 Tax=Devosia sp. TaxID=1871048 RepID=UPI003263F28F
MFKKLTRAAFLAAVTTTSAFAHITLATKQTPVGSPYKALFQVGHGCDGAATTKIRVQIPEGVIAVKPQPKPGWTVETVKGKYAKSYDYYGTALTEGVKEVVWGGGNLPDDFYDEFLLRGTITADLKVGSTVFFPVIQECGDKSDAWIEIPADGQPEPELPPPGVKLIDAVPTH